MAWTPSYDDFRRAVDAAEGAVRENVELRCRVQELSVRLLATELTPAGLGDLMVPDLARLAHHYQALVVAITDELRARHHDIAEELITPRVRALEEQLAAAKQRAWEEHTRAHDLEHENGQLRAALAAAGSDASPASPA